MISLVSAGPIHHRVQHPSLSRLADHPAKGGRRAPPGCRTSVLSSIIMRSGRTKVWATSSSRPSQHRSAQGRSRAVRGSAACSSSTTARPRSPMGRVFAHDAVRAALAKVKTSVHITELKSAHSRRTIALPAVAIEAPPVASGAPARGATRGRWTLAGPRLCVHRRRFLVRFQRSVAHPLLNRKFHGVLDLLARLVVRHDDGSFSIRWTGSPPSVAWSRSTSTSTSQTRTPH
jgi:hypothetical protein